MGSRGKSQSQHIQSWILKDVSQGFRSRISGSLNCPIKNKSLHLKSKSRKKRNTNKLICGKGYLVLSKSDEIRYQFISNKIHFTLKNNGFYSYFGGGGEDDDIKGRGYQNIIIAASNLMFRNKVQIVHLVHKMLSLDEGLCLEAISKISEMYFFMC